MPVVGTKAAASAQGFGEFAKKATAATYIEDVFSTYLYTGNGTTQTITNGIDESGKGALTWIKNRSSTVPWGHALIDTARGNFYLQSQLTDAQIAQSQVTLGSTGFSINGAGTRWNNSGDTYVSWTFRKQPKFFDVVTYTGNGVAGRTVAHNLGSVPGMIVVKRTDTASIAGWYVYHRSLNTGAGETLLLNSTSATSTGATSIWNNTVPTSTQFTVGTYSDVNASGGTYVAYLFAHNAGGFGLTGTDNVISCGSYTTGAGGVATVNLGYEPQWVLAKYAVGSTSDWFIFDGMRGFSLTSDSTLSPNLSSAESTIAGGYYYPTATGFVDNGWFSGSSGATIIYIAIRRGPMKTPTSGTSVFAPSTRTGTGAAGASTALGKTTDLVVTKYRDSTAQTWAWTDRMRGATLELSSATTSMEATYTADVTGFDTMTGFTFGTGGGGGNINTSTNKYIDYLFARAPSFMDIVCWTGTGSNPRNVTHNLGVAPELLIIKPRSSAGGWTVYSAPVGNTQALILNSPNAPYTSAEWNSTTPTASVFTVNNADANEAGTTYVGYLFASCPGVSKVGSYTGTGAAQTISCGFAARFVMIKRQGSTGTTGNWWIWDTARGMVAGTDPRIFFNDNTAEANTNWVYTNASGFQIVTTDATVNANGVSYLYLAIA